MYVYPIPTEPRRRRLGALGAGLPRPEPRERKNNNNNNDNPKANTDNANTTTTNYYYYVSNTQLILTNADTEPLELSRYRANLHTKTLDFSWFDSSVILMLRGRTLMSIGNFTAMLSQRILVGIINFGREIGCTAPTLRGRVGHLPAWCYVVMLEFRIVTPASSTMTGCFLV